MEYIPEEPIDRACFAGLYFAQGLATSMGFSVTDFQSPDLLATSTVESDAVILYTRSPLRVVCQVSPSSIEKLTPFFSPAPAVTVAAQMTLCPCVTCRANPTTKPPVNPSFTGV